MFETELPIHRWNGWMNSHIAQTEVKQLGYFACSLEVTLPLGVDSWEWLKVPDHHPWPSLQRYSFIFNLPVLSRVFCTPFLRHGANPTEDRPPVMMLVFSDVSECAPDLRGRSHVGHTSELGFCCPPHAPGSPSYYYLFPNKILYLWWFY